MPCQFDSRKPEIVANLLALYHQRSDADDASGRSWYTDAHRIVVDWADHYGLSIATVACIVAAISPQCDWQRNLVIADDVLADRAISIGGAILSNVRKARKVYTDKATNLLPYFPQGPKVNSFACNLAGDWSLVTVDTHAMQAGLMNVQANYRLPWKPYAVFAECYAQAATRVGVEPAVFQAVIWHIWKRLYPRTRKITERRQWHVIGDLES